MKNIFFCLLLTAYCLLSFSQPKLVVGIVVDQMRSDYIDKYWNKFGTEGFKRLVNEGFSCKNTNYNYVPTFTGPGHASIYTGVTPSVHGIVSNEWVDKEAKRNTYCVYDHWVDAVGGNGSSGKMSPQNLISSTVGEELRKITQNKSKVIGIALKDRGAILPAGHNASAAYWYDGATGNWITSTYYMKELPLWVNDFNKKELAQKYLAQQWTTIFPIEKYTESDADDNDCEVLFKGKTTPTFPYDLPALMKGNGGLGLIRSTPFGNTLTKDFTIATVANELMGKDSIADFLCVSFSSPDYIGHQFGPQSVEVEDCYIRLDKEIAELLKFLDEFVGKQNCLVFLTSDHGAAEAVSCLQKKNMPSGVVHEKMISDSLKAFFARTNGDSLLLAVSDFDVYLDNKRIEEKKLKVENIHKQTIQYLLKINGIADAVSSVEIQRENFQDSIRSKVKAGFHPLRSGDVIFVLKRGWLQGYHKGTTHGSPYSYDTHVPLLWWGYTVLPGFSNDPFSITQIAPTVSKLLGIPAPAGSTASPLPFTEKSK